MGLSALGSTVGLIRPYLAMTNRRYKMFRVAEFLWVLTALAVVSVAVLSINAEVNAGILSQLVGG